MKITEVTNSIKVGDFKINRKFLEIKDYKKEKKDPLLQTNLIDIDFSTENEISKILKKKYVMYIFFAVMKISIKLEVPTPVSKVI